MFRTNGLIHEKQSTVELADQEREDNRKWHMLKSTIQLRLGFWVTVSYLILFSKCLQEKKKVICRKLVKRRKTKHKPNPENMFMLFPWWLRLWRADESKMELGTVAYTTVTVALVTATRPLLGRRKSCPSSAHQRDNFCLWLLIANRGTQLRLVKPCSLNFL